MIKNKQIPLLCKYNTQRNLIQLPHYKNITLQRNRCLLTGRSYGVIKSFKLARFSLRFKVYNGYILNLKRYSN
jgi:ribosomal protein S14